MPSALLEFTVAVQALASAAVVLAVLIVGLLEERQDRARWRRILFGYGATGRATREPADDPALEAVPAPPAPIA